MKTMRKISLLAVLSAVLFFSSCLGSGDRSYIGNNEYSYITQTDNGTVYARTLAGYFITSSKISLLTPGTTAFITYQVTEETETIPMGEHAVIYKVAIGAEPIAIDQTVLQMMDAPKTDTVYFESLMEPLFAQNEYFGDRWLFPYTYKGKKGENYTVRFYKASQEEPSSNNEVLIDVRLVKTGTPESGATEKIEGDYVTVNMSMLRGISTSADDKVNIKFRYFRADTPKELYTSNKVYSIILAQE